PDQVDHHPGRFAVPPARPPRLRERSQQRFWSHLNGLILRLSAALEHNLLNGKLGKSPKYSRPQQQQRPEAVVFASFLQRQQTSAAPAGLSGRWRRQERTTPRPRPLLPAEPPGTAHKHRVRPLKPPAAAPRSDSGLAADPTSTSTSTDCAAERARHDGAEAINDSDDGERGRGPRMMQRRLRQFEPFEIESPFRTICQSPTSSLSRRLNQTRIVEFAKWNDESVADPPPPAAFPPLLGLPAASSASPAATTAVRPPFEKTV
uniref:Uncharacterized protein n=1 Tax=Macrostomum lignano TaxID=282301 RepID=A0A1I8F767_9PLAT